MRADSTPQDTDARSTIRDWLGTAASLHDASKLAGFFDLVYGGYTEDIEWCRALARRTGGPILELGCGTGRVSVPLAQDGYRVTGLDRSAAMLARAETRASSAGAELRLIEGDMRHFALGEMFSLVLIVQNTFLMLEPDERLDCLACVRAHLSPGGLLVLHAFQPDPTRIAGQDGAVVEEGSFTDGEGRSVTIFSSSRASVDGVAFRWWCDEIGPDHVLRRYTRAGALHFLYRREAELLLDAAGFRLELLHGDFDGSAADERSPRLLMAAARREDVRAL